MPAKGWRKPIEFEVNDSGCHICTSHCKNYDGYPNAHWNYKTVFIHRFIYEQANGEIPDGLVVRHKCDNPACINIEHLELGTQAENIRDAIERGRFKSNKGENNPRAVLNEDIVKSIRLDSKRTYQSWADEFGLDKSTIFKIKKHKIWKEVI